MLDEDGEDWEQGINHDLNKRVESGNSRFQQTETIFTVRNVNILEEIFQDTDQVKYSSFKVQTSVKNIF